MSYRIISVCLLFLAIYRPINCFIYGYTQLYRQADGTTLDLVYDQHVSKKGVSLCVNNKLPLAELKKRFFKTEQYFIDALAHMQKNRPGAVALIWEDVHGLCGIYNPGLFICFGPAICRRYFKKLQFISADQARSNIGYCLRDSQYKAITKFNPQGVLSFGPARTYQMKKHSGAGTVGQYKSLFDRTVKQLNSFCAAPPKKGGDPLQTPLMVELSDCELLLQILTSDKKRIVVYAGSLHCQHIKTFLEKNGWRMRTHHTAGTYDKELDCAKLHQLLK